jgi:peptidoglycan hydrolase CwlO-like protein
MAKKETLEFKLPRSSAKLVELVAKIHGVSTRQYIQTVVMNATIHDLGCLDQCLAALETEDDEEVEAAEAEVKEEAPAAEEKPEEKPAAPARRPRKPRAK